MGLSFTLEPEQEELRQQVRRFAEERIVPQAAELNRNREFPLEIVKEMGELGLFGLQYSKEYGGSGLGLLELCIAIEEIGRADQGIGVTLEAAAGLGSLMIERFGTEEQKERWLVPLVKGEALGAFGLTEPGGGSDTAGLETRAHRDGDEWVINGRKAFIGNAGTPMSSIVTITAITGGSNDRPAISSIIVPTGTPGYRVHDRNHTVGWPTMDNRDLTFEDCRVPAENLLGEEGRGLANFLAVLDVGRVAIAALAVGCIQGCLDECVRFAAERHAFGQPIGSYQGVAFKIADMAAAAQMCRDAYYRAAWLYDNGKPFGREASIAKLAATESAVSVAREAAQVFGGRGFLVDYPVGRFYQDSKVLEIGEGTSEVQRTLIARDLGLLKDADAD